MRRLSISRGLRLLGGAGIAAAGGLLALRWGQRSLVVVTVHGTSMMPTLRDGDRVLVRRRPLPHVRRGDIVVLEPPLTVATFPAPLVPTDGPGTSSESPPFPATTCRPASPEPRGTRCRRGRSRSSATIPTASTPATGACSPATGYWASWSVA
ncbi:S24/S26 family peptidase [Actinomadura madurae]|uniref:S24/S26 family peptidase n=1 Tax=Actinomadura madurae TaxID=1993 RepID=UPI003558DAD8